MALVRCNLGKFLGVVCHCFPPRLDFPTFAARCLHVRNDARDPSIVRWNYGRERSSDNFAYMASLFTPLEIFYMPQIYDMRPTASVGFEPANLGTKDQHARPPKPLKILSTLFKNLHFMCIVLGVFVVLLCVFVVLLMCICCTLCVFVVLCVYCYS
jgi:hypothetical protein